MVALAPISVRRAFGPSVCAHLAPIERTLATAGIAVGPGRACPHDPEWGTWFEVDVVFDAAALCSRLGLDPCVTCEEYDSLLCASDVTFYCGCCAQAIVGLHPRTAPPGTPRVA